MKVLSREFVTEGVLIVASILVAFSIDAWWAERQDRLQEVQILTALRTEFELNVGRLPAYINQHNTSADAATALIRRLRGAAGGEKVVVKYSDLYNVLDHVSFDAQNGTLNAVLQSGDLRLIGNAEIRSRIAGWPATLQDATENEVLLRTIWGPRMGDVLGREVDLSPIVEEWGCDATGNPLCVNGETALAANTELFGVLLFAHGWATEAALELEHLHKETEQIVALIDEELGTD